ncbi:MAG: FK506-binding protein [Bacteroidetes bacterium ADurb.Bin408]|nr:MAG: FK506-binding protein [Bacteroidetes bacterium ADurb.Bin408]
MKLHYVCLLAIVIFISSCKSDGFKTTKTGLKYRFEIQNNGAEKPQPGDILELKLRYSTHDSIIFNSDSFGITIPFKLIPPLYPGDVTEGMAMMGVGDSAIFIASADSFFLRNVGLPKLPYFIEKGSTLTFHIKLVSIKKKEIFEKEQEELNKQKAALLQIQRNEELPALEKYLKRNNITIAPTSSGLYYIEQQRGKGKKPTVGQVVVVHYKGMLINGQVFDSSYNRNQPISFKIGSGQVIEGFEEGIAQMREGGKAQLIIPSAIGYGDNELENIPPYSTLIYEVELVKVE